MTTPPVEYVDAIGQPLAIGDYVAFKPPSQWSNHDIIIAPIIKFTPQGVSFKTMHMYSRTVNRARTQVIKISDDVIAIAKLSGNDRRIWKD
jgi:hypothetical protein